MGIGFYVVMAAQFFSALADNALLICAIALLQQLKAPPEYAPLLKTSFTLSYVVLAAFVGAFADSMPKWRVMFISNSIKIVGCGLMLFEVHPLLAYAVVGLGAAAYSPAKYGILTEMLPPSKLVTANGWIEGLTVGAIILGSLLGGLLILPAFGNWVLAFDLPVIHNKEQVALLTVGLLYVVAAVLNRYVPDTGVASKPLKNNPLYLVKEFGHCVSLLWRDRLGQISLAVTTLFWGAGATIQFIVIDWADQKLGLGLSQSTQLQGVVAVGVAIGAIVAARMLSLRQTMKVIPIGIAMGLIVPLMVLMPYMPQIQLHEPIKIAGMALQMDVRMLCIMILMVLVGGLSGFFVVPMNALLQHRGHVLMGAGHSIAVQNFNENLSILMMTWLYSVLVGSGLSVNVVIVLFGFFVAGCMYLVKLRHLRNQAEHDDLALLEEHKH
ncbi:lysophospholipid transporter LplT [Viridibacterium curvum]|uniref:Lysophospholipid transporter LplT n=1 Tax=Viridibacterium curvum TaxID=1101404 RepID=A0ABP9QH41_9RHOO